VPDGADLPESCLPITAGWPLATRFIVGAGLRAFERVPVAIYIYGRFPRPSSKRFILTRRGNRDFPATRARSFQSRHVDIGYARIFDNRTR